MNAKLAELLKKHNAEFNWNEAEGTWCLSGTDKGNGWETDDFEAGSLDDAESDAINYLVEYNS